LEQPAANRKAIEDNKQLILDNRRVIDEMNAAVKEKLGSTILPEQDEEIKNNIDPF
jgi:hypothetical protein